MKKNIELLMAKHFAELAVCNLDAVMKDDSLTDKEYNNIRDAHDSIASARDTIVRLTKPQRMVSAEAKENGYGESEDEEIVKLADEYYDKVLLKECGMEEKEAHHCRISYIHGTKAILERQKQKSSNWNEEDEARLQSCLNILQVQAKVSMGVTETINTKWIKSLKQRYAWKPTSAQMKALDSAIDEFDGYQEYDSLVSLKKDLEKLKGE